MVFVKELFSSEKLACIIKRNLQYEFLLPIEELEFAVDVTSFTFLSAIAFKDTPESAVFYTTFELRNLYLSPLVIILTVITWLEEVVVVDATERGSEPVDTGAVLVEGPLGVLLLRA